VFERRRGVGAAPRRDLPVGWLCDRSGLQQPDAWPGQTSTPALATGPERSALHRYIAGQPERQLHVRERNRVALQG